jgi:RNA polymerase sigma-70 factor (ECF subfamily)
VRAKCRRLLGASADAEEVAHESFVRLWQSGPSAADPGDSRTVLAWLYRTSTRLSLDALRRRRQVAEPMDEGAALPCGGSLEDAVAAKRLVLRLIETVSAEELEAVVLCRIDGVTHAEAAEILAVSERTVRRLVERFDAHTEPLRQGFSS